MTVEEARREFALMEAELGRRFLMSFTRYLNPSYADNWHHLALARALDRVVAGECRRLMVFMPPQHGKTELASRNLPAYALGRNPDLRIVAGTYNATRASKVSGELQRIMDSPGYRALFPQARLATGKDVEKRAAATFEVVGRYGSYSAFGVGQHTAGYSMDLGIIDDPYGSRADAESEAYRAEVARWYKDDITSRQSSDGASIILIQTRWHEDDLASHLLRQAAENRAAAQWEVVCFPAVCEAETPGDPRKVGEALWPARYPITFLNEQRAHGVYEFSSLYQQRPIPAGGAMAQRAWFKVIERGASGVRRRYRAWDLAATKETSGRDPDWTVGTLVAELFDGSYLVEHVVRARLTPSGVDSLMRQTALADGRSVAIREWQDPGQAGKAVVDAHLRMLSGYDYEAVRASGEKTLQWRPFLVQAEAGRVAVARGDWNTAWLDEMSTIPYGRHDDQADSVALAFNCLTAHVESGPSVGVVMPAQRTDWQARYFSALDLGLDVADPLPPRRAVTFGAIPRGLASVRTAPGGRTSAALRVEQAADGTLRAIVFDDSEIG